MKWLFKKYGWVWVFFFEYVMWLFHSIIYICTWYLHINKLHYDIVHELNLNFILQLTHYSQHWIYITWTFFIHYSKHRNPNNVSIRNVFVLQVSTMSDFFGIFFKNWSPWSSFCLNVESLDETTLHTVKDLIHSQILL